MCNARSMRSERDLLLGLDHALQLHRAGYIGAAMLFVSEPSTSAARCTLKREIEEDRYRPSPALKGLRPRRP